MNIRLELFLSGTALVSRILYLKGGRRVVVLDRLKRRRQAIDALAKSECDHRQIAASMNCSREFVACQLAKIQR